MERNLRTTGKQKRDLRFGFDRLKIPFLLVDHIGFCTLTQTAYPINMGTRSP